MASIFAEYLFACTSKADSTSLANTKHAQARLATPRSAADGGSELAVLPDPHSALRGGSETAEETHSKAEFSSQRGAVEEEPRDYLTLAPSERSGALCELAWRHRHSGMM